ncbi:FUSC family protein [Halalkalibacter urbisdiaboli]|uniref:FUSC family protein n=1 Tax=Halalkalibacter urbisdiaboli TaxID=1960589 RepID=UPI000B443813|nr:aromatic acid exporter family protein [Halalkalibacter urbisdiaboli]
MRTKPWIGRRVLKTGLAVFITAFVCHLLDLPVMFAVITAIVTTEPTAADSIKKGIIRLPAAALGAAFAIILDLLIGQHALTYALVAMLTIVACSKLNLDTGTLVATLTAVAMIPGTTDHLLADFVTRISGTSVGIIFSTLVNFVVLPPKFGPILVHKVDNLFNQAATSLQLATEHLLHEHEGERTHVYRKLHEELTKTYQLTHFQYDEWRYRKSTEFERRSFGFLQKKLDYLHLVLFHIGKVCHLRMNQTITQEESRVIHDTVHSFKLIMNDPFHQIDSSHYVKIEKLKNIRQNYLKHQPVLYQLCSELISLHSVASELALITTDERRFSMQEQAYPDYIFAKKLQYD